MLQELDEEVFYFCTEECFSKASFLDPEQRPRPWERGVGAQAATDPEDTVRP